MGSRAKRGLEIFALFSTFLTSFSLKNVILYGLGICPQSRYSGPGIGIGILGLGIGIGKIFPAPTLSIGIDRIDRSIMFEIAKIAEGMSSRVSN